MPTLSIRFTDPSIVDVKLLQLRRKRNKPGKSHGRVLQLHDTSYDAATGTWSVSFAFHPSTNRNRLSLRVLGLDRAKNVVASITAPARRFPKP